MNRIEILKWLLDQGLEQQEIAAKVGVSPSLVSFVISGKRLTGKAALKVRRLLRRLGCPKEFLTANQGKKGAK
jgi:transcriptional regulator with XRE-family HTH domain